MDYKNRKTELIAPAGDLRKLKFAFAYGADAVYCGLPSFSLRAQTGFDFKTLKEGIEYAHKLKKRVYVTINIFAHNRHLKILPKHLKELKKIKPDAIVISDPGIFQVVKKFLPKMPIHLSTQANILNYEAVKFWQKQGVERIILGREASLKDIKEIHKQAPKMELEVFVHGAMCMSYSGRCYLSAWLNKRSANEGLCTQPCRWDYRVYLEEPLRPGMMIPIESDGHGTYIMNSKDLCLIDHLADLEKAGVSSFKIEGRTKSVYYLAVVTKAYRRAIKILDPSSILPFRQGEEGALKEIKKELDKIDNRGYTTGFLLGDENQDRHNFKTSKAVSDWGFVGEIVETFRETSLQKILIKVHNVLKSGEMVELVTPENCYRIKIKEVYNKKGEKVAEAHGGTTEIFSLVLDGKFEISPMSVLRSKK